VNRRAVIALAALVLVALVAWSVGRDRSVDRFTGFVEGEERVVRSEVIGRIVEVAYREGDEVPPDSVVARVDASDVTSRIESKRRELDVLDAESRSQEVRVRLTETTWERDLAARRADVDQATSAADLAERTFARERDLVAKGASTAQFLDDARAGRDQAKSALERSREMLARTEAEKDTIEVARRVLDSLGERRRLLLAQIAELDVTRAKHEIRSPSARTIVQTQYVWPGELAQPGAAIVAVLDPLDKYVQVYVPVEEVGRFTLGRRVEIELDSVQDERIPGEVVFVADRANFTPEKIETRDDRIGQVYRAKVRILEGAERLQPGTEGDVFLVETPENP
jgi:multidrug resistance efflux pump